jgi:hypothetical protein|tara:strand:- start:123 stop:380 length:258 start_codon:yes stop_codon:yes gene_type:complete
VFSEEHVVELIYTILGSAIIGLIGFVWKISHRVTTLQGRLESLEASNRRDLAEVRRDIDTIYANVDKNREWTTNRMMSIAKEMGS